MENEKSKKNRPAGHARPEPSAKFRIPYGKRLEMILVHGEMLDESRSWPVQPKDEDAPYVYQMLVDDGVDLMDAIHAASVEYLRTPEGARLYDGKNDDQCAELDGEDFDPFTIKEFWYNVPSGILKKHGLERVDGQKAFDVHDVCTDEPMARYAEAWPGYRSDFEKARDEEEYT